MHRQPGCWLRSSHSFKECVIAHWSSGHAPKMYRGSNVTPKHRIRLKRVVEEHSVRAEARPRGLVDFAEERMPV